MPDAEPIDCLLDHRRGATYPVETREYLERLAHLEILGQRKIPGDESDAAQRLRPVPRQPHPDEIDCPGVGGTDRERDSIPRTVRLPVA